VLVGIASKPNEWLMAAFWRTLVTWWRRRGGPGVQAAWDGLAQAVGRAAANTSPSGTTASPLRDARLGWLLLLLSLLYGLVVTVALVQANSTVVQRPAAAVSSSAGPGDSSALRWPIIGAGLPQSEQNLAAAKRDYRKGVSQGFVLTGNDAGVPIGYGQPVLAAADGEVLRLDSNYREMTSREFQALLRRVRTGASAEDMDRLRGRQVWLRHSSGTTTRYGHLASTNASLRVGERVRQGQIIGSVGNSGLADGVRGGTNAARLLFEVWAGPRFLGEGLSAEGVRIEARDKIQGWP
jgi:peptidoglycan LD-endopeptidase LytH